MVPVLPKARVTVAASRAGTTKGLTRVSCERNISMTLWSRLRVDDGNSQALTFIVYDATCRCFKRPFVFTGLPHIDWKIFNSPSLLLKLKKELSWGWRESQWAKCLSCKHEDINPTPRTRVKSYMWYKTYNPSIEGVETGGYQALLASQSRFGKTLSQKIIGWNWGRRPWNQPSGLHMQINIYTCI